MNKENLNLAVENDNAKRETKCFQEDVNAAHGEIQENMIIVSNSRSAKIPRSIHQDTGEQTYTYNC